MMPNFNYYKDGYEQGRKDERAYWTDSVSPDTMVITIRSRDGAEHIESIGTKFLFRN